jgi:hypothetical protein
MIVRTKSGPGGADTPRGLDSNPKEDADMSNVVPSPADEAAYRRSVEKIRDSIFENTDLVFGLAGLRRRGPLADEAVNSVLEIPELQMMRLSWELVAAFIESDDGDPEVLFADVMGDSLYERSRFALFGVPF